MTTVRILSVFPSGLVSILVCTYLAAFFFIHFLCMHVNTYAFFKKVPYYELYNLLCSAQYEVMTITLCH